MQPFDDYPEGGRIILERKSSGNARRGYGLRLMEIAYQTSCAYCSVSLVDDYYRWLLLNVDHVIPVAECARLGIPEDWQESYSNIVLACFGCNLFDNRYSVHWQNPRTKWTEPDFFDLRDSVFAERKARIEKRRSEEKEFYERRISSHLHADAQPLPPR